MTPRSCISSKSPTSALVFPEHDFPMTHEHLKNGIELYHECPTIPSLKSRLDTTTSTIETYPPTVQILAICSLVSHSENDNDDGAISSLSSCQEEFEEESTSVSTSGTKRSIFSSYWKRTGQTPLPLVPLVLTGLDTTESPSNELLNHSMEPQQFRNGVDHADPATTGQGSSRRSIFGASLSQTAQNRLLQPEDEKAVRLELDLRAPSVPRKASSAPTLCKSPTKLSSILRSPHTPSRRRGSSVSFDARVDVLTFQKHSLEDYSLATSSCEQGAAGWESYFTC